MSVRWRPTKSARLWVFEVGSGLKSRHDLLINPLRQDADAYDLLPRKLLLKQKFRLLAFLTLLPVSGLHCIPVDLAQLLLSTHLTASS